MVKRGKGYSLTKREYLNKTQKRREVKDLFEKESCREKSFLASACLIPHGDNSITGNNTLDSRASALVISMNFYSIVNISCLRVFFDKTSSSHAPCFSLSPIHLDLGY